MNILVLELFNLYVQLIFLFFKKYIDLFIFKLFEHFVIQCLSIAVYLFANFKFLN